MTAMIDHAVLEELRVNVHWREEAPVQVIRDETTTTVHVPAGTTCRQVVDFCWENLYPEELRTYKRGLGIPEDATPEDIYQYYYHPDFPIYPEDIPAALRPRSVAA